MAVRLLSAAKLLCCLSVMNSVPGWSVGGVTVSPVPAPTGIEAQAKFFQDFFSVQLSPYKLEFGHVCEDPHTWEQRYRHLPTSEDFDQGHRLGSERHFVERHERSRPAKGLFSAKVRWGDKNGGYGEHYWDLNHAGNSGNHGGNDYYDDDGSYHERPNESYNDGSEESHNYDPESYSSEDVPQYEEGSGRAKRAHSRSKVTAQKSENENDDYEEPPARKQRKDIKSKYHRHEEIHEDQDREEAEETTKPSKIRNNRDDEEVTIRPRKNVDKTKARQSNNRQSEQNSENRGIDQGPQVGGKEKNHYVLVVNQKEKPEDTLEQQPTERNRFVNYEGGSGVRQHHRSEAEPSASASRLFLETQTGHIVDRMTGQAYVLQPVQTVVPSNRYK